MAIRQDRNRRGSWDLRPEAESGWPRLDRKRRVQAESDADAADGDRGPGRETETGRTPES